MPFEAVQRRLDDLRFRGFGGSAIRQHRAIYQIRLSKRNLVMALLLPLVFNLVLLALLGPILRLWQLLFAFWQAKIAPGSAVELHLIDLGHYLLPVSVPGLGAGAPGAPMWWGTLIGCVIVFLLTTLIARKRFLPLSYIVRACVLIQASALAYFHCWPAQFPYDAAGYLANALTMALFFLFMAPWILGLTYYIFSFSLRQNVALTALILAYFIVALPMQYLMHAYALHHLSLLYLPLFYLVFGIFLDVMMFVALYSWGMSWRWGGKAPATGSRAGPP